MGFLPFSLAAELLVGLAMLVTGLRIQRVYRSRRPLLTPARSRQQTRQRNFGISCCFGGVVMIFPGAVGLGLIWMQGVDMATRHRGVMALFGVVAPVVAGAAVVSAFIRMVKPRSAIDDSASQGESP